MKKTILKLLYFAPAILVTAFMLWVGFENIIRLDGPYWIYVIVATFWISGALLSLKKWYGGVIALIIPIGDCIYAQSGFAGHMHIDTLPYIIGLAVFYIVCGYIVYKTNNKEE